MKTVADFTADPPGNLKEIVLGELWQEALQCQSEGRAVPELPDGGIDKLMDRVYERIERETLAVYKSNEPWALKAWAFSHILKDSVADEVTESIADELMSPVRDWQAHQPFDPVGYFRERLEFERKTEKTIECYILTAARFVSKIGRKKQYTMSISKPI